MLYDLSVNVLSVGNCMVAQRATDYTWMHVINGERHHHKKSKALGYFAWREIDGIGTLDDEWRA